MRRLASHLILVSFALLLPGCREVAQPLGAGPAGPMAADHLVGAIAARFGPIERGPAFDAARPKLARAAMVPSRVFDDPGLWTTREAEIRQLVFSGHRDGDVYRLDVQPSAPPPADPGDYRGRLRLRGIDEGRFEWTMREELAVGPVRPGDLADALSGLFRSAEGVTAEEARASGRRTFPRATAAFSRLWQVETLDLTPADGATAIHVGLRLNPDGLRETAPEYAAFLDKWAAPVRLTMTATDQSGTRWWSVDVAEMLWTVRLRVRDGSLVPLDGASDRRVPDDLRIHVDYSTKAGIFTIGVRNLVVEISLTREPGEKGYEARYRQEPEWRLPFLIKPFLRSSLRYPFEGPGSSARYAVREGPDGPTELVRDFRFRVRESWIMRWMGGRSDEAVGDFRQGAEVEADRYSRECLYAVRDDVVTLLNGS